MRGPLLLVLVALATPPAEAAAAPAPQAEAFEQGVAAYRRGAFDEADLLWREALEAPLSDSDRARVLYDLGNAAWRSGRREEALGFYAASLRLDPRHSDARANLALARAELGLPPGDAGDLGTALVRALDAGTRAETAWAVLAGALLLLGALVGEALRGGRAWRAAAAGAGALLALATLVWVRAEVRSAGDPYVAIRTPGVSLTSEPRTDLPAIANVPAGEEVERVDALGDWLRVELDDGTRGWAKADELFRLRLGDG